MRIFILDSPRRAVALTPLLLRIPSNASVASKSSGGKGSSMERNSERSSPMPLTYSVEMVGGGSSNSCSKGLPHITQISHSVNSPHYQDYRKSVLAFCYTLVNVDIDWFIMLMAWLPQ